MKLKIAYKHIFCIAVFFLLKNNLHAQYKEYKLNAKGDTINAITKDGLKTGKWVTETPEMRGEPGYVEEGAYKKGQKDGLWRKYTTLGDIIAVENYILGGKDGIQQYFTFIGDLEREESWKGYNPDDPYDTIPVYGVGSGEIVDYKIVKAEPYSVKNGEWKYYQAGNLVRKEFWENNNLVKPNAVKPPVARVVKSDTTKIPKTPEMLEWERKNRRNKSAMRDGRTAL